jgi:hypothetical protein
MSLTEDSAEGIRIDSASLVLDSKTSINVRLAWTGDEGNIADYAITVDGRTAEPVLDPDGQYMVVIPDIAGNELDTVHTIIVTDQAGNSQTLTYSALSYAYNTLTSDTANDKLKNLCKCMYLYNQAADVYYGNS